MTPRQLSHIASLSRGVALAGIGILGSGCVRTNPEADPPAPSATAAAPANGFPGQNPLLRPRILNAPRFRGPMVAPGIAEGDAQTEAGSD